MAETGIRGERDSWLAPGLLLAGVAAILYATLHADRAQDMNPGVEGAVTAGVLAPMLLLVHGLRFSEMLKAVAPIWLLQVTATAAVSGPVVSGLGIDLCLTGAVGILIHVLASRKSATATSSTLERDRLGGMTSWGPHIQPRSCPGLPARHDALVAAVSSSSSPLL